MDSLLNLHINNYWVPAMAWNIFLAIIPCFIVYLMGKKYQLKKWTMWGIKYQILFILLFIIWLAFLPNTAYLMTDVRHLVDYCEEPGYLRVCREKAYIVPIFFTYALIGVPTFYYALSKMTAILRKLFNKTVGRIFPIVMIPIISLGVMLGLVARFNSWDLVYAPFRIFHTAFVHLSDPNMLINIASYMGMLFLIYYFIRLIKR